MANTDKITTKNAQELLVMLSNNSQKNNHKSSKSERTKLIIIESAIKCFVMTGARNTTYEIIAKEAKVSRPLIMKYFPVKDELFYECSQYVVMHLQKYVNDRIIKNITKKDICEIYIKSHLEWAKTQNEFPIFFLMFSLKSTSDKQIRKLYTKILDLGKERIMFFLKLQKPNKKTNQLEQQASSIKTIISGAMLLICTEKQTKKSFDFIVKNSAQLYKNLN